jgi:hypothetical protein
LIVTRARIIFTFEKSPRLAELSPDGVRSAGSRG